MIVHSSSLQREQVQHISQTHDYFGTGKSAWDHCRGGWTHFLCTWLIITKYNWISTFAASYNLPQRSPFCWAVEILKGRSTSKMHQVCNWSANRNFSVILFQVQAAQLSDPRVDWGLLAPLELWMMPMSLRYLQIQLTFHRNLPYKFTLRTSELVVWERDYTVTWPCPTSSTKGAALSSPNSMWWHHNL